MTTPLTWSWYGVWPLIAVGITAIVAMVVIGFHRSHRITLIITLSGLVASFWLLVPASRVAPEASTALLDLDGFAIFFIGLILASAFVVAWFAYDYLERRGERREEFYVLLLTATLGAATLAASNHFASFFLSLELLSVSLYGLCAYPHRDPLPLEAGIKYLVLASSSAAFLLFGMALIYDATGELGFAALSRRLPLAPPGLMVPGMVLILVGIGFKLGLVPFHLWTPDVYQGSPAPVSAFIATASKAATFAVLIHFFYLLGGAQSPRTLLVISVLAIASMVGGNLLALRQRNIKRLLAYSSIAHMGYILVAFEAAIVSPPAAAAAVGFYFLAYFITMLGAFGVISGLTTSAGEPETIEDYRGLFWQRPGLALLFAFMLLSLAGIPLTAGFLAKFYIIAAGAAATLWLLLLVLVITSVVGLFYYLRVIAALFVHGPQLASPGAASHLPLGRAHGWVLGLLLVALIWVGVYPQPFLNLVLHLPLR